MMIGEEAKKQYEDEGYFLLPNFASEAEIEHMCAACDHYIEEFDTSVLIDGAEDRPAAKSYPWVWGAIPRAFTQYRAAASWVWTSRSQRRNHEEGAQYRRRHASDEEQTPVF